MKKIYKIFTVLGISIWIPLIRLLLFVPVKVVGTGTFKYITMIEFNKMRREETCIDCPIYDIDLNKYRQEALIAFIVSLIFSVIIYIIIHKIIVSKNDYSNRN